MHLGGTHARLPAVKRLHCPTCANEVFFDSLNCVRCLTGLAIELGPDGAIAVADVAATAPCINRADVGLQLAGRRPDRAALPPAACSSTPGSGPATRR